MAVSYHATVDCDILRAIQGRADCLVLSTFALCEPVVLHMCYTGWAPNLRLHLRVHQDFSYLVLQGSLTLLPTVGPARAC